MEASAVFLPALRSRAASRADAIPWSIYAVLFASTAVVVGIIWDISWHRTIGRDTFWTPAHLAEYVGGVVAGIACGWTVLRSSFWGTNDERAASVRFWHYFFGPVGAWVCIWGTFTMLTSAPFDNWWHNAYGLDVEILSPPHTVLAAGIISISFGAMLMTLASQNRVIDHAEQRRYGIMYAYAAGIVVTFLAIMGTEYLIRLRMHQSIFYMVACGLFPFALIGMARGSRLRWPATAIAGVYMTVTGIMVWILPLFPGEPKLGPIFYPVTHFVPPDFPLLLIVPALAIDLVMRRFPMERRRDWWLSLLLGVTFFAVFLATQWLFGYFIMSPWARNWFFAGDAFDYGTSADSAFRQFRLLEDAKLVSGLAIALAIAIISSRAGLWWGKWLAGVRR